MESINGKAEPSRQDVDEQISRCIARLGSSNTPAGDLVTWATSLVRRQWPDEDIEKFLIESVSALIALSRKGKKQIGQIRH